VWRRFVNRVLPPNTKNNCVNGYDDCHWCGDNNGCCLSGGSAGDACSCALGIANLGVGGIVGIVAGAVVLIALIVLIRRWCIRRRTVIVQQDVYSAMPPQQQPLNAYQQPCAQPVGDMPLYGQPNVCKPNAPKSAV
jgi:hypothetical protein